MADAPSINNAGSNNSLEKPANMKPRRSHNSRAKVAGRTHMKNVTDSQVSTKTSHSTVVGGIRGVVSKKKRRFIDGDFDLDLTYITQRLIAMGFPAENFERIYRNSMDMTVQFFEERHKDHFWIYNLCSERTYNEERFKNRVVRFGFDDHNCPIFESMQQLCEHLDEWLSRDPDNVAALHCKAGKGRTGLMICVYLIHTGFFKDPEEAMQYYAVHRTKNQKGVTIPSQRRWVHYYAEHMKRMQDGSLLFHKSQSRKIKKIIVSKGAPKFNQVNVYNDQSLYDTYDKRENPYLQTRTLMVAPDTKKNSVSNSNEPGWKITKGKNTTIIDVPDVVVWKDVKIQFEQSKWLTKPKRAMSFWFHTDFIDPKVRLHLTKDQLDKVNKQKNVPEFYVDVVFDDGEQTKTPKVQRHLTQKLFPTYSDGLSSGSLISEPNWLPQIQAEEKVEMIETMKEFRQTNDDITLQIYDHMDNNFGLEKSRSDDLWHYVTQDPDREGPVIPKNRNLSDEQLVVLGIFMQGNLDIKNRVWGNVAYQKSFVGAEAAAWLQEKIGFEDEEDIIAVCSRMLENRFFDHLPMSDDDTQNPFVFLNTHQFYRFNTSIHTIRD